MFLRSNAEVRELAGMQRHAAGVNWCRMYPVKSFTVEPRADLAATQRAAIERLAAHGWQARSDGRYGSLFLAIRGGSP